MKSAPIKAFFSCSFRDEDKEVNEFVRSICEGLDISCANVDSGYAELPPDKAKDIINDSDAVVAVAVKRNRFHDSDDYSMPEAVSNEISFAYSFNKPILLFKESGVRSDGFINSYGTHLAFNRDELFKPDFLKKAVTSIHNLKLGCLSSHELLLSQEVTEFIAEKVSHLFELEKEAGDYIWQHSMQRTIVFTKTFNKFLKVSRWNDFAKGLSSDGLEPIRVEFEIVKSSRHFDFTIEYEEHSAHGVNANIKFTPTPTAGDSIEYFVSYRGKNLCPIYVEDTTTICSVEVDGKYYSAFDGIIPVNRAKDIEIQFRFPRDYKLPESDVCFFVGSFIDGIEFVVDSEISRAKVKKENVGGKLSLTANLTSPLLKHVYGVAWTPPLHKP